VFVFPPYRGRTVSRRPSDHSQRAERRAEKGERAGRGGRAGKGGRGEATPLSGRRSRAVGSPARCDLRTASLMMFLRTSQKIIIASASLCRTSLPFPPNRALCRRSWTPVSPFWSSAVPRGSIFPALLRFTGFDWATELLRPA
jgi:hypothetical protein